jgi:hypothetical protein
MEALMKQAEAWGLSPLEAESSITPLKRRALDTFDLPPFSAATAGSGTTLATLEEDLALLASLNAGATGQLRQLLESKQDSEAVVEVVRLGDFLSKLKPIGDFSIEEIDQAVEELRQKLYDLRQSKRRALWD